MESKLKSKIIKQEVNSESSSGANDDSNLVLSELKVKLSDVQSASSDWKNRLDDEDGLPKSLSPSALSSDTSSIHSGTGKFDTEFCVGQRIEVKDYRTDTWYTAKIVEVDFDDREIFIHYERWSVRFDEWLKWDSQRIRKIRLPPSHHRFKPGEHVLATWSYTKKYPAVVKSVFPDDKYEVLFYDGFAKILKGNRITKIDPRQINLLEKMPKEIPRAPPIGTDLDVRNIGTKEERRQKKRRLNVVELLQPTRSKQRKRIDDIGPHSSGSFDSSPEISIRRRRRRQILSNDIPSKSSKTVSFTKNADSDEVFDERDSNAIKYEKHKEIKTENVDTRTDDIKKIYVKQENDSKESIEDIGLYTEKDSNSEQEFTGFDSSPVDNKAIDVKDNKNNINVDLSIVKLPNNNRLPCNTISTNSNLPTPLQTVRRISKRGRIPKLKTSLGNITSTPRLTAFPKIKPRGRLLKPNNRNVTKGRGRYKNRKFVTSALSNKDSIGVNSNSHLPSSLMFMKRDNAIKMKSDNKTNENSTTVTKNNVLPKSSDISNKEHNSINDNSDLLQIGDVKADDSNYNSVSNSNNYANATPSTSHDISPVSSNIKPDNVHIHKACNSSGPGATTHEMFRKKGRRVKRSLKKFDEKKSKSWKIASRRKADEEDDPERWSGDIPDGAKPVFIDGGDGKMRQSIIIPDKKLPPGWTKHTIIRKNSSKWDVLLVNPNGRKFRSRKDLRTYYNELNKDYPEDCFDFVVGRTKMTSNLIEMEMLAKKQQGFSPPSSKTQNKKKESKKSGSDDSFTSLSPSQSSVSHDGEKRVKTLMPKLKPPVFTEDESIVSAAAAAAAVTAVTTNVSNNSGTSTSTALPHSPVQFQPQQILGNNLNKTTPVTPKLSADVTASSGTASATVNNPPDSDGAASWICPKDSCGKHFRKENLLQMHIKHYHPEYNQFLDSAPNVADLAYARTVGEPLDETVGAASFLDRINRYEARKKAKGDATGAGGSGNAKKTLAALASGSSVAAGSLPSAYSPLRKALLKGIPPKDGPEFTNEDLVDGKSNKMTSASSPTSMQVKHSDSLDQGVVDNDNDRVRFDSDERGGKFLANSDQIDGVDSNYHGTNHSTLKELLSGNTYTTTSCLQIPDTPKYIDPVIVDNCEPVIKLSSSPSSSPCRIPLFDDINRVTVSSSSNCNDSVSSTMVIYSAPECFPSSSSSSSSTTSLSSNSSPGIIISTNSKISGGSFDESAPNSPLNPGNSFRSNLQNPSYRFSRNKPLVALEKLNVTTDSNGRILLQLAKTENGFGQLSEKFSDSVLDNDLDLSADLSNCTEADQDDLLKKEEIINCLCGYAEEDGLMIQCDLCLCWQHGFCNNIKQESDVPEKYICSICRNPKKMRSSCKYSYNLDWLKDGKLPTLSFRHKNKTEIQQRETVLKRSHDLVATLLQLQKVTKSLRLKTHISGKSDHPKLYLWAKSWEKETKPDVKSKIEDKDSVVVKKENEVVVKKENVKDVCTENIKKEKPDITGENIVPVKGPQVPVPEAPIDLVECRLRLLEHIEDYQTQVESRLDTLESQIVALESQDLCLAGEESSENYPQTKQTAQMMLRDLITVRKIFGLI